MKRLVVLSGAGVSAESGIPTFRASDGLWEGHDVMDVATPEGWQKNPELVLDFYNKRREVAAKAEPNSAHLRIAELEKYFHVDVITQNVDGLHERAGSTQVLHLHGELSKVRSTRNPALIQDIGGAPIHLGDRCPEGSQLRPHIVWFGEAVPMMEPAVEIAVQADVLIVIGTSLVVYPAASLVDFVKPSAPIYVVDPNSPDMVERKGVRFIQQKATKGMEEVFEELLQFSKS